MIIGVLSIIEFGLALVVGGTCFAKSIYFFSMALSNQNSEVTSKNRYTSFNFTNALWVSNALNPKGKMYRAKAFKNLSVFIILVIALALVNQYVQ